MTREIPHHMHDFELTKVSTATTYHLRPSEKAKDGSAYHVSGWALATVNDGTGEVNIQSDWGNWSYRWHINHLGSIHEGRLMTLTEFIGNRSQGGCDYLADKLCGRDGARRFDADKTVDEMQKHLCEQRLEQGRIVLSYYEGDDSEIDIRTETRCMRATEIWSHGRKEEWMLDADTTRSLYDQLDALRGTNDERDFVDGYHRIDGHELITDQPWEWTKTSPTSAYEQLLYGILPALVRACSNTITPTASAPTPEQPA